MKPQFELVDGLVRPTRKNTKREGMCIPCLNGWHRDCKHSKCACRQVNHTDSNHCEAAKVA
jgi:hypothetical protein